MVVVVCFVVAGAVTVVVLSVTAAGAIGVVVVVREFDSSVVCDQAIPLAPTQTARAAVAISGTKSFISKTSGYWLETTALIRTEQVGAHH
ncbi:MAG TPA: hypothetical protein VNE82_16785 [Candidatus Binataceae bacterium]|nr:hypothetical protein [Candidatus Binataceae bacterium]